MHGILDLILHIGAHRTGTTAFQQLLARNNARLRQDGVAVWGPDVLRSDGLRSFVSDHTVGRDRNVVLANAQAALAPHISAAEGCARIVVSDENLVGAMRVNYASATLYPDAGARLKALSMLLPLRPSAIIFTIRDLAGYWRSVHAHLALRGVVGDSMDTARLAASAGNSWLPVMRAIRSVFADAPLRVMRYDNGIVKRLSVAMLGTELAASLPVAPRGVNAALSAPALAEVIRLPAGQLRQTRINTLRRQAQCIENPFSPEETTRLDAAYDADWVALRSGAIPGVVPDEPACVAGGER